MIPRKRLNWPEDFKPLAAPESRLGEMLNGAEPAEPLPELAALLTITTEDRLRGAIVESLQWLDTGAPGRAYSTLLEALRIHGGLAK